MKKNTVLLLIFILFFNNQKASGQYHVELNEVFEEWREIPICFLGTVLSVVALKNPLDNREYDKVHFQVNEVIKGNLDTNELIVYIYKNDKLKTQIGEFWMISAAPHPDYGFIITNEYSISCLKNDKYYTKRLLFYQDLMSRKDGYHKFYDDNGELIMEGNIKHQKPDGLWIKYCSNTRIFMIIEYNNSVKHGIFREFKCSDGRLFQEGEYFDGKQNGVWRIYTDDQIILNNYSHDKIINIKEIPRKKSKKNK